VLCLASGAVESVGGASDKSFGEALGRACRSLCDQLAWDGEGVTRLIRLRVSGASDEVEAGRVAKSVIDSPLVKCAVHGGDANWGRLIMAIGKSGVAVDPTGVSISIGQCGEAVRLFEEGEPAALDDKRQAALDVEMGRDEVWMTIELGRGKWTGVWTGVDLSHDYVSINADYTT